MINMEIKTEGMTDPRVSDPCYNSDLAMKAIEYDPKGHPNSQRAINQAMLEGLEVIYPAADELQIDIDNEHSYRLYLNQKCILNKFVGIAGTRETYSKSGNPWKLHITIKVNHNLTTLERIGLQAMMGSDRVRELLSYVQYREGDEHPTLFLEKTAPKQLTGGQ